jgi:hypothetical protein
VAAVQVVIVHQLELLVVILLPNLHLVCKPLQLTQLLLGQEVLVAAEVTAVAHQHFLQLPLLAVVMVLAIT